MYKITALPVLLLLSACNTPEARLERLQHEFWEQFAQHDFFEIKLKNEVLHWPLPPAVTSPSQQKALAESLQNEANAIEINQLSEAGQKQLNQLRAALKDCVERAGNPMFDPTRCVVSESLKQFAKHPELPVLLEKIPPYYAQIEQQWQIPDARFVAKAVEESQNALDLLDELKSSSEEGRLIQARGAVKDFIGLCQSAILASNPK